MQEQKVSIDGDDSDENGMVQNATLRCEKCGSITEVDFEKSSGDSPSYTTGRGKITAAFILLTIQMEFDE